LLIAAVFDSAFPERGPPETVPISLRSLLEKAQRLWQFNPRL
jgi:hypothetical protein